MDLKIKRIGPKLKELFNSRIDLTDIKGNIEQVETTLLSRSLAALSIIIESGIDVDSSSACVTDGYNDLGIDAIYCDTMQKRLFLVQSKWRSDGQGSITQTEMQTFIEGVKRILNDDLSGANQKIISKQSDIYVALNDIGYQIVMLFCHTGNQYANSYVLHLLNDLFSRINDENNELIIYREIMCVDIYNYLANGLTADVITLDDVVLQNWGSIEEQHKAYYGVISARQIGDWFKNYGNRLFDKNIRFYKGDTDVNTGMRTTLLENPEDFFYFNNGIKLLCKKITRKLIKSTDNKMGVFTLEGVSLVNGAQTTGSIGSVYCENPDLLEKAFVLIQLIDLENVNDDYLVQITKHSNTQNKVGNLDFVSLDPVQEKIKKELSLINIRYSYKTGSVIDDLTSQITLEEAIVALACSQGEISNAVYSKSNIGRFTEDLTKSPYKLLFNPSTNVVQLANCVSILRETEKTLKKQQAYFLGKKRLTLVHGNRMILHFVISQIKNNRDLEASILDATDIESEVKNACESIIPKMQNIIENNFLDSYPAYIFKNVSKCNHIQTLM